MGARKKPASAGDGSSEMEQLTVAVRIRPLAPAERARGRVCETTDDKMITMLENDLDKNDVLRQKRRHEKHFVYDIAFGEDSSQKQLYEKTTRPLVQDILQGFNATVFAYGPTGAGKTYTMVGTPDQPGIMVRAMNDLFKTMASKEEEAEFKMTLSYLEIYNENIRDLLKPGTGTLDLREDSKKGTIEVAGLSEVTTQNTKEVMKLLTRGNKQRTMESTAANATSSRSHALLQVNVSQHSRVRDINETVKTGRLYMIDLAGSERAKRTKNQGKRLQEGAHINRSLLALGNCINALAVRGAKYVNYRDSKLTRLLKDALSGNCRTVMIAHISPATAQRDETFNTLVYADRAKNITNKVKSNVLDVTHQVSQYQNIIAELKNEITRLKEKMDGNENEPDETAQPAHPASAGRTREQEDELRRLRAELMESFQEQMELRKQLMEMDNILLWLAMEFEKQTALINELEQERVLRGGGYRDGGDDHDGSQRGPDEEESEELMRAWDDLKYIQDEEQRYQDIRKNVEADMLEVRAKAAKLEEGLPDKISTDEQRELLQLLLKTHELEIENMEIRTNQLIKDHELRRRDLMIMRYDRQRALCDEIISRQREFIHDIEAGNGGSGGSGMPPELQRMYQLYLQDVQTPMAPAKNTQFLNGLNDMMRSPSMLSMRDGRLPPISSEREERLFQPMPRRSSLELERLRERPESPLSVRSPGSSVPNSANSPLRLPPIQISSPEDQHPRQASSSEDRPSSAERAEMREGLQGLHSLRMKRRNSRAPRPGSMDDAGLTVGRRDSISNGRRGSISDGRKDNISDGVGIGRRWSSSDKVDSMPRSRRASIAADLQQMDSSRKKRPNLRRRSSEPSDDEFNEHHLPAVTRTKQRRRKSVRQDNLKTLPSITAGSRKKKTRKRSISADRQSVVSFALMH